MEDLKFAEEMMKRRWFDWAQEVAVDLIETSGNTPELRGWAAELHVTILDAQGRVTGDETYSEKAEALRTKYERMFPNHPAWGGVEAKFAKLEREVGKAQKLASSAELEPDEEKRAQMTAQAVKMFEALGARWEKLIIDLRKKVAEYPPKEQWPAWAKDASKEEIKKLLDYIRQRNQAEYLYAMSFIYYSKVLPEAKKRNIIEKGLRKFMRLVDGDQEHPNDFDPPARGETKPRDPDVRDTYPMILYMAEIGIGQCYLELGDYKQATEHFEYMVQAELPRGYETSRVDLERVVDIRLQAYYLDGLAYNQWNRAKDAEMILKEMLSRSGKDIQPDRGKVIFRDPETGESYRPPLSMKQYWEKKGELQVIKMPDVREHPYGKFAIFQLAEALTTQGRYSEGIDQVYKIFAVEQAARKGGQASPFEVEAAKKMAELSEKVSTVKFPIGAAFAVARGFYYQKKWDEAILALKKVYGSPGSPEEVSKYAPKALFELGKLLYEKERYLEAGIALAEVCERFQEFPQISKAASLLKQSFRNHRKKAKDSGRLTDFEEEKYDWAKKVVQDTVPATVGRIRDIYDQAGEYMSEKNYQLAAETYNDVRKTYKDTTATGKVVMKPVPFYALALAQRGLCLYQLYRVRLQKKKPKEALEHLKNAVKILEDALKEATEAEDKKAQIISRYYLSRCLTEEVWKGKQAKEYAKEALTCLAPFKDKFKDDKTAQSKMADVFATMAMANFKLKNFSKMHSAFLQLEKKYKKSDILVRTSFTLYERMRKRGDLIAEQSGEQDAASDYEKAAYYIYAWFKAEKSLKPAELLWTGKALSDVKSYAKASEVLGKYFKTLPPKDKQTDQQKEQASSAKVLLAQVKYGMGDYETAAGLFDYLRMILVCPKCKYRADLNWENFDKPLPICPRCNREEIKLEKVNDAMLPIQEGAARSYLAQFEKRGMKDMKALNRAQDIYQRIFKRLDPSNEKLLPKYWEVGHAILKIYFYKSDFDRIVKEIKLLILLSSADANVDNPTEEDWKRIIPVQPWRDKLKELYKKALKKVSK
jgi:tetratricopeptide (TPR) repeat protein